MADIEDTTAFVRRMQLAWQKEFPAAPAGIAPSRSFWHVHFKAFCFIHAGPDEYRRHDPFHQPPPDLHRSLLDAIVNGCAQILQFRGLSAQRPLEDLDFGLDPLLRMFHFVVETRVPLKRASRGLNLEVVNARHVVHGSGLRVFNLGRFVPPRWTRLDAGPPCPYCRKRLRTPLAKQCRHCGADWHNPDNVVRRKKSDGA